MNPMLYFPAWLKTSIPGAEDDVSQASWVTQQGTDSEFVRYSTTASEYLGPTFQGDWPMIAESACYGVEHPYSFRR